MKKAIPMLISYTLGLSTVLTFQFIRDYLPYTIETYKTLRKNGVDRLHALDSAVYEALY